MFVCVLRCVPPLHSEVGSMKFFVGLLCGIGLGFYAVAVHGEEILRGINRITGCGL